MSETTEKRRNSLGNLFRIFAKTSRNRIILTLICGIIIFMSITFFSLLAYNYRYNFYIEYFDENENYLNDGHVSVVASRFTTGNISLSPTYIEDLVDDFSSFPKEYFPNITVTNSTSLISAQYFTRVYNPLTGQWEPESNKILSTDDETYAALNTSIIQGRLPQNSSELIVFNSQDLPHNVSSTIVLYDNEFLNSNQIFTVVGIIEINETSLLEAGISVDIFDYDFEPETPFFNYQPRETFLTNFTLFSNLTAPSTFYRGELQFLVDMEFNCDAIRISKINEYLLNLPEKTELPISYFIQSHVHPCEDLKVILLDFVDNWIEKTIQLMTINIPLLLIIGVISAVVLNIGAKDLDSTYRRMKLHGLSYNNMRSMILLENSSFSVLSLVVGMSAGLGINYLIIFNQPDRPPNYYIDFLQEPLLLMLVGTFFVGFFLISYYVQNSIARKASETVSEEFKQRRGKIRKMFSTNEFRMFAATLVFTLVAVVLYFQFGRSEISTALSTNISYVTVFWFLISCGIVMLLVFLLLIVSRLISLFWTFINKVACKRNYNIGTLSIKHLTVSKKTYQLAILTALIFGVLVLPTLGLESSLKENLLHEANLNVGASDLAVLDWTDPEDERDYVFEGISEIENYTEVVYYQVISDDVSSIEPAVTMHLVGLENPAVFLDVINYDLIQDRSWTDEDVTALSEVNTLILDKKTARKLNFKPGNHYSTREFTRNFHNYSIVHSSNYFPCAPIPKKSIFDTSRNVYTIIGSFETIRRITRDLSFSVSVYSVRYKLINAVNDSVIPSIKEQLGNQQFIKEERLYTIDDMYNELYSELDLFTKYNLLFYAILVFVVLAFVGYFTGSKAFEERVRVVEVLYRVGSERNKILGIFLLENTLVNILPILLAMFISLPLIRLVEVAALGSQETFHQFKPGIPFWLFLVVIIASIVGSTLGWMISMVPKMTRYKPIKQE